jgi:hypothetical protein
VARKESAINFRASDRFKRLVQARALSFGVSESEYVKQAILKGDKVLAAWLWSDTSTDELVQVPIKITQKESEK